MTNNAGLCERFKRTCILAHLSVHKSFGVYRCAGNLYNIMIPLSGGSRSKLDCKIAFMSLLTPLYAENMSEI